MPLPTLVPGLRHTAHVLADAHNTAAAMGSGTLPVFATPALAALGEAASLQAVSPALCDGETTVGASLTLHHNAPTPPGLTVRCDSELVAVDGRRLTFRLVFADDRGPVGDGEHIRYIVDAARFAARAAAKAAPQA